MKKSVFGYNVCRQKGTALIHSAGQSIDISTGQSIDISASQSTIAKFATDGRTDRQMHEPCSAYYAGSMGVRT